VDSIVQYGGHCQVTTTSGRKFKARKVIMANPTNTYADIRFAPPLPQAKKALVAHTMPGKYAKMVMSFREPWWRKIGLVGKFTSLKGPICFSWDTSDPGSEQYSLAFFIAGQVSQDWHELSSLAQEVAVLKHLAQLVGPEHAHLTQDVIEINTMEWTKESFIGGAPTCSMGPRQLSQYGVELRKPFNDVHFAGGETAFEWKGYLEGAISAGYRAAEEVTSMLQPAAKI
jgi:monoamine oxidase